MNTITRITYTIACLAAIACLLSLPGCNDANKTDASPTSAGVSTSHRQPTPDELAKQAEQYANRLDAQQNAPSPYPPAPNNAVATTTKPAEVQWIKPQPAPPDAAKDGGADSSAPASTTNTSNANATPPAEPTREELIKRLADDLKPRSAAQLASIRPWLKRASLAVVDPSYELSSDDLKSLSPEDRQLVLAWQRTFAQLGRSLSDDDKTNRATLVQLAEELQSQIQEHRDLAIATMKLCTRVNGFGVYDAIDKPVFLAGSEHPVIVYAELENFRTKLDDQKHHIVQLSQEMVLYNDADGLPVWRQRPVAINDVSANQRRDFFTVQIIQLSDRLSVGKYILKLRVTDEVGSAVAETSLPLQIVADPKLTTGK